MPDEAGLPILYSFFALAADSGFTLTADTPEKDFAPSVFFSLPLYRGAFCRCLRAKPLGGQKAIVAI